MGASLEKKEEMRVNNLKDNFLKTRNDVNEIIDELVESSLADFENYEEAIQAISKIKWDLTGYLGDAIISEAINRIKKIALKKATHEW